MDQSSVLPRKFAYHLLEEMTNGFSEDRELGRGSYGKVYLGMHKSGEKIAVKMLHPMIGLDDAQFEKEYLNLEQLRHQNIVQLVGYCNETSREFVSFEGKRVLSEVTHRALCFEYMQNKSLANCLSDESSGHDWHTRYAIIKGICKGLQYLHEELKPPIFHLDLKPANVLLDQNRVAKIADFGLSTLMGSERTRITTSPIGTIGYLPPEYINQHVISSKLDIFSLGVIIIKIMAGPMGYSRSAEMSSQEFNDLVHENWRNRLQTSSMDALESYCEQIKRCVTIALTCVKVDRHKRPTIGDIVNELNEDIAIFKPESFSAKTDPRHSAHSFRTQEGNEVQFKRPHRNELNDTNTISQFPDTTRNTPGSSMQQGTQQTQRTKEEQEEEKEREGLNNTENLFGEIVDNYKLDKMKMYMGKPKMREDRAHEAFMLIDEGHKDGKATKYVQGIPSPSYGNTIGTLCLIYNATGHTIYLVANHDWIGQIGKASYPTKIANGQWAAFRHCNSWPQGSMAVVVYRGKNKDGEDQDYLLSWSAPLQYINRNKCYCEIGGAENFQKSWPSVKKKLGNSGYPSNAKSDGCEIEAKIGKGQIPKFTAIISYR